MSRGSKKEKAECPQVIIAICGLGSTTYKLQDLGRVGLHTRLSPHIYSQSSCLVEVLQLLRPEWNAGKSPMSLVSSWPRLLPLAGEYSSSFNHAL